MSSRSKGKRAFLAVDIVSVNAKAFTAQQCNYIPGIFDGIIECFLRALMKDFVLLANLLCMFIP